MKSVWAAIACLILFSCGNQPDKQAPVAATPRKASVHNAIFNNSMKKVIDNYYQLKDAFVASDSTKADLAAKQLAAAADSFQWGDLKDSSIIMTAVAPLLKSVSVDAASIAADKNIEEKRKTFSTISENLYQIIQAVKFDNETVYHQFCPMAFNDAGAFWLSNTSEIANPYFGKRMLTCGEVKDSIGY